MEIKKKISSFSIILTFVCLSFVGLALLPMLSVKLSPAQTLPQISVEFSMYGSGPRTVEIEATSKLEAMFNRMSGIRHISSTSGNGWGRISIEFDKHTDMDIARFEVSTIVRQLWPRLPENVSYPRISQSRADQNAEKAFLSFTINASAPPQDIQDLVESTLRPQLSMIAGVNSVAVSGSTPMVWQLLYDADQLNTHGILIRDIQEAITNSLQKDFLDMAFAQSGEDDKSWISVMLSPSETHQEDVLKSVGIKRVDGVIVPLGKIVKINRIESQPQSYYRINGLNSIYLTITADESSNQLELGKKIHKKITEMHTALPSGYEVHTAYDATEYIKSELQKIYFRAGLTLIILLIFIFVSYRNLKYMVLIVVTLGCNLAIAMIGYYLLKLEIQLYALAGITISLTLIIDNTIVMADHLIRKNNSLSFMAVLAATMTTIGSLSIIFFLDEKLRLSLQDFAAVIIINLLISLLIALFLVPALVDKLKMNQKSKRIRHSRNGVFFRKKRSVYVYFARPYSNVIRFMQRWRAVVIAVLVLTFGLPVFLIPDKMEGESKWTALYNKSLGSAYYKENLSTYVNTILGGTLRLFVQKVYNGSYFSRQEETTLLVSASLPSNSTIKEMNGLIQQMESFLSQFSEIKQFQTQIHNARQATINILFTEAYANSGFPHMLKARLITKSLELGGGSWGVYGLGDGFSNDVRESAGSFRVEMYGFNYDDLMAFAEGFKSKLLEHRRIKDVIIESEFSWFKDEYEEFRVDFNKEKLAEEDIQPYQLYDKLSLVFGRDINVGSLMMPKGPERLYLSSTQSDNYDRWSLLHMPVENNGKIYKLAELAQINKGQLPREVGKIDQQYRLCLQYEYIGANEQGKKLLDSYIEEYREELPTGYTIINANAYDFDWWGDGKSQQYWLLLLIFVIIYFVSSILFNSLTQPLYIIFVIPVSFIGIFLSFYLFGLNFDQGGFASFILLSGLTINANIYIINEYNNIRKMQHYLPNMKIYLKAWNAKARPILLTVLSTILGFIPFLIGDSKEAFWFPLAVGTIGGLTVSTLGTFLFLPLFMGIGKSFLSHKL
ncbi:efflux RND transporter permease subunit [Parapedobacter koreensis]|uniref:Multidrug efflux pump subunit AcrB n=1 Tax=Parapedobacter koreensis TaxID=332977 RepID=A0A1H7F1W5_9SPHI|nr:efflux RND transporter permease subunit [Parapedobacter koreensis]SEK20089.1 Multidrug efflux pump subunit AcrB [Parapedobacter koreensis]